MDISRIRYFVTVYETQHLRKAAELLNISPSAVSKGIHLLEHDLHGKLFTLVGRNLQPTEFAHHVYPQLKEFFNHFENLEKRLQGHSSVTKTGLRIGSWEIFSSYFLTHVLTKEFIDQPLQVLERTPGQIEDALVKNDIDLGITYAPIPKPNIDHFKVAKIRYGLFGRKDIFGQSPLEDLPFATPLTNFTGSPTGVQSLDNWPAEIKRQTRYQFELLETSLEACREGLCVLFCPSFVIDLQNQKLLKAYRLEKITPSQRLPQITRDVFIAKRSNQPESSEMKKLAKVLRQVCNSR